MQQLQFRACTPHLQLRPYITRLWVLEGQFGVESEALKLIAPNGMLKLILIYKGRVRTRLQGQDSLYPESSLALVGQTTDPAIVDPIGEFGTVGIEFSPVGIYKLFPFSLDELTNRFHDADDLFGREGRELRERIGAFPGLEQKIEAMQAFLLAKLHASQRQSRVTEYAVSQIVETNGLIRIADLCADTGYTRRHLGRLFHQHVGISPKELAGITRLQLFYRQMSAGGTFRMDELYDYYYDQSHFAREFRRLTGLTPGEFARQQMGLGKVFHRT